MFVGHYGPSFAIKALRPAIPLWLLFIAVQLVDVVFGTEETIQLLLDAGAIIDARDMNGDSPLTWAGTCAPSRFSGDCVTATLSFARITGAACRPICSGRRVSERTGRMNSSTSGA